MILLLKGADLFVEEAARISRLLGISEFIIGLTLVSIGTSLPELATNIAAASLGNTSIVLGNIIGSNIANIGFVLGIAAILTTIVLKSDNYIKDSLFLLATFVLFFLLALDGSISATEGIVFLTIFVVYMYFIMKRTPIVPARRVTAFVKEHLQLVNGKINFKNYEQAVTKGLNYRMCRNLLKMGIDVKGEFKQRLLKDIYKKIFSASIGLVAIYIGARYLISSTIDIASLLGISSGLIAVTVIAIGTSLPELFVTFTSAHKGMGGILVGNLIGSGVANVLLVGGVSALITPLIIQPLHLYFYFPFMIFLAVVFLQFIKSKWITKVLEGSLLLLFYAVFIFFTLLFQGIPL